MTPAMREQQQSLTPGARVELYDLDLRPIGVNEIYHFTPSSGEDLRMGGVVFVPAAIGIAQVEKSGTGENADATLTLPNVNKFASALIYQHDDLVGAEIRRRITFENFLDGEAMADEHSVLSDDVFVVEQKLDLNRVYARFKLRSLADQAHRKLPGRTAVKLSCGWRYRRWDPERNQFDYSKVQGCGYTGSAYFRRDGSGTVDPNEDTCGKALSDCKKRFGAGAELDFGGFPGMNRIRIR